MFVLVVIVLVVWVGLSVLLAAWTLFFQGYIYNEPVTAVYWRAPAAGAALALFVVVWMVFDYRSIEGPADEGRYRPLHEFSARQVETYEHLWVANRDGKLEHYERRGNQYVRKDGRRMPERPNKIFAAHQADGDKRTFEPELDAKNNFKVEKDQALRYYDKDNKGRYMEESALGQVSTFRFGWLAMNLLLNFGFLVVWFLALWLVLRFQWSHALGLAFVFWLAVLLFVMPPVLAQAEKVKKERLPPRTAVAGAHKRTRPRDVKATGAGVGSEGMCRIHPSAQATVYPILAGWQANVRRNPPGPAAQVPARMCMMSPSFTT